MFFSFIRIKMVEMCKYTHRLWLFILKYFLGKKKKKTLSGGCDQNKTLRTGIMLVHVYRFFVLSIEEEFPCLQKMKLSAVGAVCLLCLGPRESKRWLGHAWPCRAPFLHRNRSARVTCPPRGDTGDKPDLKASPFSWITCTWMELPEHVPVTDSWELGTA